MHEQNLLPKVCVFSRGVLSRESFKRGTTVLLNLSNMKPLPHLQIQTHCDFSHSEIQTHVFQTCMSCSSENRTSDRSFWCKYDQRNSGIRNGGALGPGLKICRLGVDWEALGSPTSRFCGRSPSPAEVVVLSGSGSTATVAVAWSRRPVV